jgi:hypothetical protein
MMTGNRSADDAGDRRWKRRRRKISEVLWILICVHLRHLRMDPHPWSIRVSFNPSERSAVEIGEESRRIPAEGLARD